MKAFVRLMQGGFMLGGRITLEGRKWRHLSRHFYELTIKSDFFMAIRFYL